jgi:hypothetical protein
MHHGLYGWNICSGMAAATLSTGLAPFGSRRSFSLTASEYQQNQ